ncbi:MAG: ATP-dependent zinc metalloprotease FtsH [Fusobacteriaceae bacterium]|nr:ATP-dependent zinc metalloprotease FtsH [Fusobacteriaceae bacterium]
MEKDKNQLDDKNRESEDKEPVLRGEDPKETGETGDTGNQKGEKSNAAVEDKGEEGADEREQSAGKDLKTPEELLRERQEEIRRKYREDDDKKENKNPLGLKGKMNFKTLILIAFLIAMAMSIPTIRNERRKTPTIDVSYTEFNDLVRIGKIDRVEEREGFVNGFYRDDPNTYRTRLLTMRLGEDQKLLTALEAKNIRINSVAPEAPNAILAMISSWFPFILLIGIWAFMMNRMNKGNGGGPQIFNMGKSRAKEGENLSKVTFKDVAGIVEAKGELEEVVEFLREPDKFRKVGAKIPKGVLLLGAPGTGKTLLAKAVAGEAKVPFFSMSGSEFVEMFVGVGASRVRDLFNKARKNAPCIVFIDEIDAVGRKRGTGSGGGNDEREQTLNQLLVEMDGFGNEETIIVIAATNRPDVLDRALLRPGRFDRRVYVDIPDINGREAILKVHLKGKTLGKDVNLKDIAKQTYGLVGADLANILNEAAILAARAGRKEIMMVDIQEATEKVAMGPEKKSKVVSERDKRITAFHEAGHAVVTWNLKDVDPVYKVTIVPRGWAGGYTLSLPDSEIERTHKFKSDFLNDIKILYGGRAAEEIIFSDISTGASNDIERATSIAHAMVTKFGMAGKFGPILLDATHEGDMFQSRNYSDVTGKEVDAEIFKIIHENYAATVELLKAHKDKLELVAEALVEKDTIDREEFEALMKS